MRLRDVLLALAITGTIAALPAPCLAQYADRRAPQGPPRFFGGAELIYAAPQGDFHDYVKRGWGGAGHFIYALDPAGIFTLRAEGGILNYGNERERGCISTTIGCRILVDVTTSNNIFFLGVGPQLMAPTGRFRPYVNGTAGLSYFSTQSSVEGTYTNETFASTTNFKDAVFATTAGGGFYIPMNYGGTRFSIDVGAKYHWNGKTRYLREGSITDLPDGTIEFTPIESRTDMLVYHLGVSFGAR